MRQVDVELFEIMPKLQILLHREDIAFNNNNKQKRVSFLDFTSAAILYFMMSLRCRYCWEAEVLLCETTGVTILHSVDVVRQ